MKRHGSTVSTVWGDVRGGSALARVGVVPPLHSGDTGDGHGEDDEGRDDVGFRPPLPRDDRLWRHPSEVAIERAGTSTPRPPQGTTTSRPGVTGNPPRRRTAALMVAAGMVGATLAVGAVAALGGFRERVVQQRVAVAPMTSVAGQEDSVAALAARTAPTVAALRVHGTDGEGTAGVVEGSAVVFRSDGYLLTNASLVDGARRIDVVLPGGPAGEGTVVGTDPVTDVAVLRVERDQLQTAAVGTADGLSVGVRVVAVGAMADSGWDTAVSTGVVSAMGRRLQGPHGSVLHDMILIDAPFAPGAAGGALVDASGAVVGVTSALPASRADGRFGVATPIDIARLVADQIIQHGRATHVWLGIQGTDLSGADAAALDLTGAARVEEVFDQSPALAAGIRADDLIVGVDDHEISSMSDLIAALRRHVPGDEVVLVVRRGDEVHSLSVVLSERTDDR